VSDLATLLSSIAAVITAIGGTTTGIIYALRTSRRERPRAAQRAAELLLKAAEDGRISDHELATMRHELGKGTP
jgi:hypothetical protein